MYFPETSALFYWCILGIGFFQQSWPELIFALGLNKDESAVQCGQFVINDNVNPLPESPELKEHVFRLYNVKVLYIIINLL